MRPAFFVIAIVLSAVFLTAPAPAGRKVFTTFWVQWDGTFTGHSTHQTGAGTETHDAKISFHGVCDFQVPTPLPSPNTNNPPSFLCLHPTPDLAASWYHRYARVCGGKCYTVDTVTKGAGAGRFIWPEPAETKLATWKGDVDTQFWCWVPPDQNAWATAVVTGIDFEAIAREKGKLWTRSRSTGALTKPYCTANFSWHGTVRISLAKPATVPPPKPGPTGTTPGSTTGGGCAARINSVTFSGSAANPSIAVHGTCLGSRPSRNPAGHPSGLNGCPVVANDNGYDYGTSLYIAVPSQNFSGGRYRPSLNETDCLDLVVTKFTSTEIDFRFGPFYTTYYPKFALTAGLPVTVVVNGATANATVKYA